MKFLGLKLFEHDSNITYTDGPDVYYYKSERDSQRKHHVYYNLYDWRYYLEEINVDIKTIDAVGIVIDEPHLNQDHWRGFGSPQRSTADADSYKNLSIFNNELRCPVFRIDHHDAHRLSSWPVQEVPSTKDFVMDGWGDDERSSSAYEDEKLIHTLKLTENYSIALGLGSLGSKFKMTGHELDYAGKLMALKSYGNINVELLKEIENLKLKDARKLFDTFLLFGGSKEDWLRTIHDHCEKIVIDYFSEYASEEDSMTYSGGTALNVVFNTKLKQKFPQLEIPPHCTDEGLSLGIVEYLRRHYAQPPFSKVGFPFWQSDVAPKSHPTRKTIKYVAEKLAENKIVGWYQGHGEVGPRALGNRSILMNPTIKDGKDIINSKVKHREWFRPFGASVLLGEVDKYFEWNIPSPYMLYAVKVLQPDLFPAIIHVDGTSRIQTVEPNLVYYYSLIKEFEKLTGIPMVLNTSLNVQGQPIAARPRDALHLFMNSGLDILVIGNEIYTK